LTLQQAIWRHKRILTTPSFLYLLDVTWPGLLHFPITAGQLHWVHYRDQRRGLRLLKNPSNHNRHWNKQFGDTKGFWLHIPSSRALWKPKIEILTINLSCRTKPLKHYQDEYLVINCFECCKFVTFLLFILLSYYRLHVVHFVMVLIVEFFVLKLFTKS